MVAAVGRPDRSGDGCPFRRPDQIANIAKLQELPSGGLLFAMEASRAHLTLASNNRPVGREGFRGQGDDQMSDNDV